MAAVVLIPINGLLALTTNIIAAIPAINWLCDLFLPNFLTDRNTIVL